MGMQAQKHFRGGESTLLFVLHVLQHTSFHSSSDRNSRLVHLSRRRQEGQNCVQIPISLLFLNFEAFEKVCNGCFHGCLIWRRYSGLESNSSSSGTGCEWSVSVLMLGGGQAESRTWPLNHEKKRYVNVVIYLVYTIDILDTNL